MPSAVNIDVSRMAHPVDVVERVADGNDWMFERSGVDEISISVRGRWKDYQLSFSWMDEFETLHLACAFDFAVPGAHSTEIIKLLARINEQMLMGHFDIWESDNTIMYRQSQLFCDGLEPTQRQIELIMSAALEACECYYPAFQYVVWSGVSAETALNSALFETAGHA